MFWARENTGYTSRWDLTLCRGLEEQHISIKNLKLNTENTNTEKSLEGNLHLLLGILISCWMRLFKKQIKLDELAAR